MLIRMKKIFLLTVFTSFVFHSAPGVTWKTISPGIWSNPSVWQGGITPPIICGDTILIQHPIVIANTITLTSGAHLIIDNYGGICGHHEMIVQSNAKVIKYGILELDILNVPGGHVLFSPPGNWKLSQYGIISNGGYFHVNGAGGAVGPWFDCQMPEYNFLTGVADEGEFQSINVYPNPSTGNLFITNEFPETGTSLRLLNATGAEIMKKDIRGEKKIEITGLAPGIYFLNLLYKDGLKSLQQKIIITDK